MYKLVYCVILVAFFSHAGTVTAQGFGSGGGGGGSGSGGGFGSGGSPSPTSPSAAPSSSSSPATVDPTPTEPDIGHEIVVTPRTPLSPTDVGIPEPLTGPDGWLPYTDPNIPPELPGIVGYCGPTAVCGGTPSNGIPTTITPSIPAPQPTPNPENAVVKSNNGFPSIVALTGGIGQLCTGVLVSNTVVLTVAHCVCGRPPTEVWIGNSVIPDAEYRKGLNMSRELKGEPVFFTDYDCNTKQGYDLAAMFLADENFIRNSYFFEYVPQEPVLFKKFNAAIVGFGSGSTSTLGGVKRVANIQVEACSYAHVSSGENCIAELEWISFSSNGVDTCKGDSGGPLYMHGEDGTLTLVGLTSRKRGGSDAAYCGDGGIYVNLTEPRVTAWINELRKEGDQ